jgi:suppressor of ftsI/bilirubin oxidase
VAKVTRRSVLGAAAMAAGTIGLAGGFLWRNRPRPAVPRPPDRVALPPDPEFPNALRLPGAEGMFGIADASGAFTLSGRPLQHAILPGKPARVLGYEMDYHGRTLVNPVLRARTGSSLRIKLWNGLDEPSIIHWHGFKVDSNNDGHPHYVVPGGATYDYQFTIANRAGTYWYHPHPHYLTGKQVHHGLAGFFIVTDDEELALQQALDLRLGETDIPLLLQDRRLDENGAIAFAPTGDERLHGHYAGEMLINWTHRPHFDAETRVYRFRMLNGSNARIYRLAFRQADGLLDYHVIGNDGGLLDRPRTVKEVFLAPGERVDALLDLRNAALRDEIVLASLPFDAMHDEMHGAAPPPAGGGHDQHAHAGHGGGAVEQGAGPRGREVPDGAELKLLKIRVNARVPYDRPLPRSLSAIPPVQETTYSPRLVVLDQSRGRWRINGIAGYDMAATPITVKRDTVEAWDIRNVKPSMPHPMHIHGFQFRIVSRTGSPEHQRRLAVTESGLVATDLGWKDTVLSWPGETVRIVTDFSHPFLGDQVYMVHCHNLEHEDGGMMLNMKVAGQPL